MLKLVKVKGSPNWYIRGTVKGQYVHETTGTPDKKIAEAQRAKLEATIHEQALYGVRRSATFGEVALKYIENGGRTRFLGSYDPITGKWSGVVGRFLNTPINEIGQSELDAAAKLEYPDAKPQTVNRQFHTPFIVVWNFGAREGMCQPRNWRRPQVKRADKMRRRWFTPEQAKLFLTAAPLHLRALLLLCAYTGLRPIEAVELKAADINLAERWAVVTATKTDTVRGVPIHKALARYLGALLSDGREYVLLTQKGLPYASKRQKDGTVSGGGQFKKAWATTARKTGLEGFSPYSLRHTLNNWLVRAGVEQSTREAIMGHANGSTNSIYVDIPQADLIEVIDRLPDFADILLLSSHDLASFTHRSARKDTKTQK